MQTLHVSETTYPGPDTLGSVGFNESPPLQESRQEAGTLQAFICATQRPRGSVILQAVTDGVREGGGYTWEPLPRAQMARPWLAWNTDL